MIRTWFAVFLLFIMLAGCMTVTYFVKGHTMQTAKIIEDTQLAAEAEDFEKTQQLAQKAISYWKKHVSFLSSFLRHEDSEMIEMELRQLLSFAQSQSQESLHATCAQLIAQLKHIRESEQPLLHNIL